MMTNMYVSEFIAAREREDAQQSPDPDITQAEWEQLMRKTFTFAVQEFSIALRRLVFAYGEVLPWTRKAVRQHAAQWCDHHDYDESWRP